jgi:hypothetical protein
MLASARRPWLQQAYCAVVSPRTTTLPTGSYGPLKCQCRVLPSDYSLIYGPLIAHAEDRLTVRRKIRYKTEGVVRDSSEPDLAHPDGLDRLQRHYW